MAREQESHDGESKVSRCGWVENVLTRCVTTDNGVVEQAPL